MITACLLGNAELRRLEKLPGVAERRIAGRGVRDATGFAATHGDERHAQVHPCGFFCTVGVGAGLRRMRQAFRLPIAEAPLAMRTHGRRGKLAERSLLRSAPADLEPAVRAAIEGAIHEALT